MIKVTALYPNEEGKRFDIDYYCNNHMTLAKDAMGDLLKKAMVEQGVAGGEPDTPARYIAIGHLFFETIEDCQKAFEITEKAGLVEDIPNYTDIEPVLQISEVKL